MAGRMGRVVLLRGVVLGIVAVTLEWWRREMWCDEVFYMHCFLSSEYF